MSRPGRPELRAGPAAGPDTPTGADRQGEDALDRIGRIQPHGFLLAVDPVTREVRTVSENLEEFIGVPARQALGAGLGDLFDPAVLDQLPLPGVEGRGDTQPRSIRIPPRHATRSPRRDPTPDPADVADGAREIWDEFEVVAHSSGDLWVLEFEPASPDHEGLGSLYDSFRRTLDHLRSVSGVDALCAEAAREVRALTGYHRVLVYRLDQGGGGGEVVADAHRPDLPSQLGLSYPESAGQVRVRVRMLQNGLHSMSDSARSPVALLSSPSVAAGGGPDLTMSVLRPITEAGRRLQLAMGVIATLTVSLVVDGRLWGLLVCQHQSARRVSHQLRASCEMLGRILALQVRAELARREQKRNATLAGWVEVLVTSMSQADSLAAGAAEAREALLGMVGADGVVLQVDGERITAGRTPAGGELDLLLGRVTALAAQEVASPWTTDALPALELSAGLEAPSPVSAAVTGVLYLPLGGRDHDYALWLRGEHVRTVSWAGASDPGSDASRGAWEQVVRGRSRSWSAAERAAAESFASAQPSLMLHRAQRVLVEQELAAAADRVRAAADRQELEQQLHQNQRLESLGHLAGGVAHDFNNLLAVILSYTEFVGDQVDAQVRTVGGQEWRSAQEDLEQVRAATGRAAELTRQLLAFARREVVELRPVSLNHVVRGLEDLLRRTIGQRVDLVVQLAEHVSPIMADPGQIEQILVNLAVNARDAMPDGGTLRLTTRDVRVPPPTPGGEPGRRQVLLEVGDQGTGIAQEILDRIFEPFFTTKATGEGTGLGLATVYGIVAQIGGVIGVESDLGHGTTFSMEFPATDSLVDVADRARDAASHGGGETVLVVEDQDDVREVTRRLLTRAGYTVLTAADGHQALEVVAAHPTPVDLLLTDLIMPLMNGDEVASRLRTVAPGLRVLFMSGYAAPVLAVAGGFEADHPLLDKPFSRSGLLSKVLEVLEQPPTPLTR